MKRWGNNPSKFPLPRALEIVHHTRVVNQTLRAQYTLDEVAAMDAETLQDIFDYRAELARQLQTALKRPKVAQDLLLLSELVMQTL